MHIGTLKCAKWFHSWNGHTVPSNLDSRNPGNLLYCAIFYGQMPSLLQASIRQYMIMNTVRPTGPEIHPSNI